jgi:hypothetical protein
MYKNRFSEILSILNSPRRHIAIAGGRCTPKAETGAEDVEGNGGKKRRTALFAGS